MNLSNSALCLGEFALGKERAGGEIASLPGRRSAGVIGLELEQIRRGGIGASGLGLEEEQRVVGGNLVLRLPVIVEVHPAAEDGDDQGAEGDLADVGFEPRQPFEGFERTGGFSLHKERA